MRPMKSLALVCLSSMVLAQSGAAWRPLFNGKDLAGWTPVAKKDKDGKEQDATATWSVVGGEGYGRCDFRNGLKVDLLTNTNVDEDLRVSGKIRCEIPERASGQSAIAFSRASRAS